MLCLNLAAVTPIFHSLGRLFVQIKTDEGLNKHLPRALLLFLFSLVKYQGLYCQSLSVCGLRLGQNFIMPSLAV